MRIVPSGICLALLSGFLAFAQMAPGSPTYLKDAKITESAGIVHITANSPRPLEQVLDALQRRFGWVVNYEDPQYVAALDLVDAPGEEHFQLPSGGIFSVDLSATIADEEKILRQVVESYNQSKNPGRFQLRHIDGNFYVVGTAANDPQGHVTEQQVPLDLTLTMPTEEMSINETLDRICQEISKQMHSDLQVGISPIRLLRKDRVKIGGTKVSARDLIAQSLLATHEKVYWRLLFNPSTRTYVLNIHAIHS